MINEKLDKEILAYIAPEGKLISQRCLRNVLIKRGWYDYLKHRFNDLSGHSEEKQLFIGEILHRLVNHIENRPKCKICGNPVIFKAGYPTYCSRKCANADPEVLAKNKAGVSRTQSKNYQERGEEIKRKRRETLQERYDLDVSTSSPFGVKAFQDKARQTILENHGVDNIFRKPEIHQKVVGNQRIKAKENLEAFLGCKVDYPNKEDGQTTKDRIVTIYDYCPIHGDIQISLSDLQNRIKSWRYRPGCLCLKCNPLVPLEERKFQSFSKASQVLFNNLYERIKHLGHEIYYYELNHEFYFKNERGVFLDFYDVTINLVIEFNGDLWHGNPNIYGPDDLVKRPYNSGVYVKASKLWERDRQRLETINGVLGNPKIEIVWEDDYNKHPEEIVEEILKKYYS